MFSASSLVSLSEIKLNLAILLKMYVWIIQPACIMTHSQSLISKSSRGKHTMDVTKAMVLLQSQRRGLPFCW